MAHTKVQLSDSSGGEEALTPNAALTGSGLWTVWQSYHANTEQIRARFFDRSKAGDPETVTPDGGLRHGPVIGVAGDLPTALWIQGDAEGHRVVRSSRTEAGWTAPEPVGDQSRVVSLHAGAGGDRLWATWCNRESPGTFSIWVSAFDGRSWTDAVRISPREGWVQRPQVAPTADGCQVVFDGYDGLAFSVWTAFVSVGGAVSGPERVSAPPACGGLVTPHAWQLVPSACVDRDGDPWVAWLCSQDVENESGVVDQWPTARLSRRTGTEWESVVDGDGCPDLGRLAWGLLDKRGAGVWGFLGRRRKPQVVADPRGGVWLLWERKEVPEGSTPRTPGILCGRRIDDAGVGPVLEIGRGPRWYEPAGMDGSVLWLACRMDAETSTEDVGLVAYDLDAATPLEEEDPWEGWRPVLLRDRLSGPRPCVQLSGGKGDACSLYWADPHVHTILSTDAEGEVDELIAYARDKAQIDCVALQDNDKHVISLMPSEYELSGAYASHFHDDGAFVMLPGFEWTCKKPNDRVRYHRSVLAPDESLPLIRYTEVEGDPMDALTALAEEHGALLHAHHENWVLTDSPAETNVEICSGWRVHMLDPQYLSKVHAMLKSGQRIGFVGASDNHRRNPGVGGGLTGIYAQELTREAILDALSRHRCFATSGSRMTLKLWVNGAFIGEETSVEGAPEVRWEATFTSAPATVRLIRDGLCIRTWPVAGSQGSGCWADLDCRPGRHFYYLAVEQASPWRHYPSTVAVARGPHGWTSPIWVERLEP